MADKEKQSGDEPKDNQLELREQSEQDRLRERKEKLKRIHAKREIKPR